MQRMKSTKVLLLAPFFLAALLLLGCEQNVDGDGDDENHSGLTAPSGLSVKAGGSTNQVTVTWTDNGATNYWIYYNTTNDTETATCATTAASSSTASYGYDITLASSGTYYFWVKAADGYSSTDKTSDFSEVATYEFTYKELSVPSGLSVKAGESTNQVTVTWTDNGAFRYWIYYNTTNDTETATCATRSARSSTASYGYDITLSSSGTYYFWVKAADGYYSTDKTSDFSEVAVYEFTYGE